MRNSVWSSIILFAMISLFSCGEKGELETVPELSIERYSGQWFEIQRFPHSFEKNLQCVSAVYTILENGKIQVYNKGYDVKTKDWKDITGSAKVPNANKPGEIKVSFFWPFAGDYYVMYLDDNYQSALIGSPSRKYLWILSRRPIMPQKEIDAMQQIAKEKGFDISRLEQVSHDCPSE